MDTISRDSFKFPKRKGGILYSINTKFFLVSIILFLTFVILLNTYFLAASRNLVFVSKKSFLQNQGSMISNALSALDGLSEDGVGQAMALLDVSDIGRITVADIDGTALYDTLDTADSETEEIYNNHIAAAMAGQDVFYSRFKDRAFISCSFTPITTRGIVSGVVFLYEYDTEQGELLTSLATNLLRISIVVTIAAVIVMFFVGRGLMQRIKTILNGIKNVREGEYTYRVQATGNDELAVLSDEFDSLTDRLQKTEEIRRRFVADASHELKTPLASIRLLSDSILQNEGMDTDTVREFISDIAHESERLARTTEKLLSLTRLDSSVVLEHKPVSVEKVVKSSLRMLVPLAAQRDITIENNIDPSCIVLATEDDLYQIIFNLIENGIKYNVQGGKVFIKAEKNDRGIVITVSDTGIGVPDEDLPYIFDRFYRVDKARSREAGGSGLGLSIVRDTVAIHGGSIRAFLRNGGGMVFEVIFPQNYYVETTDNI